jgi:hypothetical protein
MAVADMAAADTSQADMQVVRTRAVGVDTLAPGTGREDTLAARTFPPATLVVRTSAVGISAAEADTLTARISGAVTRAAVIPVRMLAEGM